MTDSTQLPLALAHRPSYGRDDFMAGPSNRAALRLIESWPNWPSSIVVLTGPPGSGKTHLVHIWAARAGAEILSASALQSARLPWLPASAALAIEDATPDQIPEEALFHLINLVREESGWLLITSRLRAEDWQISLPDLSSRLRLAAPVALGAPDDDLLRQVLVKLFADRQLLVDKPVIDYLLTRMERSLSAAVDLVEALDGKALAAGRRITRPMAALVFAESAEMPGEFADRQ
jgi:chromosomal replication initiation ATPase DnaA